MHLPLLALLLLAPPAEPPKVTPVKAEAKAKVQVVGRRTGPTTAVVKAGKATATVENLPPIPAACRITVTIAPAPSKDALCLWSPPDQDSVVVVEETADRMVVEVPATPEVVYKFAWTGREPGKAQVFSRVSVKAGHGPQPPPGPGPVPPGPIPPGPEPGPVSGAAWIIIVDQTEQRTPTQAAVLGNGPMWEGFKSKGHGWRVFDYDNPYVAQAKYKLAADAVGLPALLIVGKNGGLIDKVKMPETSAGMEEFVKKVTGL